jgi:hypothetical protein
MPATLPSLNRTIDDDFVNTWYEIRAMVIDQVTEATVFWAALKNYGCLVPQVGGEYITRSVRYGRKSTQRFAKGSTLDQSVTKLDTMARWDWRFFLVDINRSLIDDAKNSGPYKIKDYLTSRMDAAREALIQDSETYVSQWGAYYEGDDQPNGLYDICPQGTAESAQGAGAASDSQASGTSNGNINRTNNWWKNWYSSDGGSAADATRIAGETLEPYAVNFVPDLRHIYHKINANMEPPNFILMDQDIYEAYEDEVSDKLQIVRNAFTRKAGDLGFEAITYKGATMSYSDKLASTKHVFLLNMNHIELVYDPDVWFSPTSWRTTTNQLESVMFIVCMTPGLITDQPRRHGCMEYAS